MASNVSYGASMNATRAINTTARAPAPRPGTATRRVTSMAGTGKNGTVESVKSLVSELNAGDITADVDVVCAPTFVHLPFARHLEAPFQLAAQNCWTGAGGAYTGEISADMLVDAGIPWVVLGHSERRTLCGETNETVGTKVQYALSKGLKVMACIGESLEEREANKTLDVCFAQLKAINDTITAADWANVVIAYEPIWAIGTGKVASPAQAQEVHAGIRKWLVENVDARTASRTRIQYGGSVNAGNCEELAKQEDIDGFLVGGASLKAADFITICNAARFNSF